MGSLGSILPQGPSVHCGEAEQHPQHANTSNTVLENAYCNGVPLLPPFVEMFVRVPLESMLEEGELMSHAQMLADIVEEGLGAFILDKIDHPTTRSALRLRWGGEDKVYPLRAEGFSEPT